MLANLPTELRQLPQWVAADELKIPRDPRTGAAASVTDPTTWGTLEEASAAGFPFVGFVLTASDPYSIIDLDDPATIKVAGEIIPNPDAEEVARLTDRHQAILARFSTYSELSQSGTGVHIICRGKVPRGVRRYKVELYSAERFMICTGRALRNLPIADTQAQLSELFAELSEGALVATELAQVAGTMSDDALFQMASTAANADKFCRLWAGDWQGVAEWPSQSEADFALLAMLGFYSPDNEQVRRLFRWSALGQREKAVKNDRYLNYALSKIRAKTPPPCDFTGLLANPAPIALPAPATTPKRPPLPSAAPTVATDEPKEVEGLTFPPGFVGDAARYILESAFQPVPEIALAGAIALTAGICGRAYNISSTGLNQYILLLSKTGTGKESAAKGIDALLASVTPYCHNATEFMGPSAFASGQALHKTLAKHPCFLSIQGEYGITLQTICGPKASGSQEILRKVMLDVYGKSGANGMLHPHVHSDSEKNTVAVRAPNLTILGESNPETFYEGLDTSIISSGLLPRFLIIEYKGECPPRNPLPFFPPPVELAQRLGALVSFATTGSLNSATCEVQQTEEARQLLDAFQEEARLVRVGRNNVFCDLWNRAHLKALKLAALVAVGVNTFAPVITETHARWAIAFAKRDVSQLLQKFEQGEVGTGDDKRESDVRSIMGDFLALTAKQRKTYGIPEGLPVVPLDFIRRRAKQKASFRNDRKGINISIRDTLQAMVDDETLDRLSPVQAQQFGRRSAVFMKGKSW